MKYLPILSTLLISGSLLMGNLQAAPIWESDFSNTTTFPPESSTVVGLNGWVTPGIQSGNNDDAGVVTLNGTRVLGLTSSAGAGNNGYTLLRNDLQPFSPPSVVRVQFGMGMSNPEVVIDSGGGLYFGVQDWAIPMSISYWGNASTGGLRFTGADGDVTLLAHDLIKADYLYQFDVTLDYTNKTFSLTFSGEDINGQSINQTYNARFMAGGGGDFDALRYFYLSNSIGKHSTLYIDRIAVTEAIPEPTTAGLVISALLLSGTAFRRLRMPAVSRR